MHTIFIHWYLVSPVTSFRLSPRPLAIISETELYQLARVQLQEMIGSNQLCLRANQLHLILTILMPVLSRLQLAVPLDACHILLPTFLSSRRVRPRTTGSSHKMSQIDIPVSFPKVSNNDTKLWKFSRNFTSFLGCLFSSAISDAVWWKLLMRNRKRCDFLIFLIFHNFYLSGESTCYKAMENTLNSVTKMNATSRDQMINFTLKAFVWIVRPNPSRSQSVALLPQWVIQVGSWSEPLT